MQLEMEGVPFALFFEIFVRDVSFSAPLFFRSPPNPFHPEPADAEDATRPHHPGVADRRVPGEATPAVGQAAG